MWCIIVLVSGENLLVDSPVVPMPGGRMRPALRWFSEGELFGFGLINCIRAETLRDPHRRPVPVFREVVTAEA